MKQRKGDPSQSISKAIGSGRAAAIVLFFLYGSVLTYWFSSVVQFLSPGVVGLCFVLAWGSLKVSVNWIALGEVIVLLAKYGWQTPRIELLPSLWLSYVGVLLFVFRAKYTAMHSALWFDIQALWTERVVAVRKYSIRLLYGIVYTLVCGAVMIAGAFLLLTYSPFGGAGDSWVDWSLARNEAMWPGASAVSILIASVVLLREWNWRQIRPNQAAIYLRADRIGWQYRELSRVVRLMLRDKNKK
jgi:hypothetical protein